jgi:hypothetical protein
VRYALRASYRSAIWSKLRPPPVCAAAICGLGPYARGFASLDGVRGLAACGTSRRPNDRRRLAGLSNLGHAVGNSSRRRGRTTRCWLRRFAMRIWRQSWRGSVMRRMELTSLPFVSVTYGSPTAERWANTARAYPRWCTARAARCLPVSGLLRGFEPAAVVLQRARFEAARGAELREDLG